MKVIDILTITIIISAMLLWCIFHHQRLQSVAPDVLNFFSHSQDAVLAINRDGRVLQSNAAAQDIFPQITAVDDHPPSMSLILDQAEHAPFYAWLQQAHDRKNHDPHYFTCQQGVQASLIRCRMFLLNNTNDHAKLYLNIQAVQPQGNQATLSDKRHDPYACLPIGVIHCHEGKVLHINPAAKETLGLYQTDEPIFFMDIVAEPYRNVVAKQQADAENGHANSALEVELEHADGQIVWVELSIVATVYNDLNALQLTLHNVHRRKEDEARLTWLSYYDMLTELPNRRLFADRMEQAIALAVRDHSSLSLLYFDLDRFKNVNDSLGHSVGDEILRQAAMRLKTMLRESDSPVRLGGDEFGALLQHTNAQSAATVANKLLFSLRQPYHVEARELTLGASIGIAVYPDDGNDAETLVRRADAAMYHAKKQRLGIHFFAAGMEAKAKRHMLLEQELARAGVQDEFSMHYQGQYQFDAQGRYSLIGLEALIRWQHPRLGAVHPAEFIPLAEETGQITTIVHWVIDQCAMQALQWEVQGLRPPKIAINLSSTQLMQVGVAAEIIGRIVACNAQPSWFEVEITETAMMRDPETAIQIMTELVEVGTTIAMDDYGTGYSSLTYLKRLPAHQIKIDRSFIINLPYDEDDAAIVHSTIAMGHALGKTLLAEGVETVAQRDFLQQAGCDAMQGFLFNQAMDAATTTRHLREQLC